MKKWFPVLVGLMAVLSPTPALAENEIGFIERFALARDREQALSQLIPGSEDFFYFHALHYQNTGQNEKLATTLRNWAARFPESERRKIIENRAALLNYKSDPKATLEFLKDRLDLQFHHQQQARDQKPDLPTTLDPAKIARGVFQQHALSDSDDLSQVNDATLELFVREKVQLNDAQRRALLSRLQRPDIAGLLEVIESELRTKESKGFGEFGIHHALLPEQLDELAKRLPALYTHHEFVHTRLSKLAPSADVDLEYDRAAREVFLERLWVYAKNLQPAFNTLKALILHARLELDREQGIYNKERFLEYLKLPRRFSYVNPEYLRRAEQTSVVIDPNAAIDKVPLLTDPIGEDESLVREFFLQILKEEPSWEPWAAYVRDTWLKRVFAESKITNGVGDPNQWATLLSPAEFQALKERVDLDFIPTNPEFLKPEDEVSVALLVKNVPQVIVRTYEINTLSFFLTQKRELNTDLNLDGLVANQERTVSLVEDAEGRNPFRRIARTFQFPELKGKRGAWVVEFIGGGRSSRALVRKGHFHLLQDTSAAGDLITVLDETRKPVPTAAVWLEGRRFTADEKTGKVVIPHTSNAQVKPVVLATADGSFATLANFMHHAEEYALSAQFHIAREQLLAGRQATLSMRTSLLSAGVTTAVELLQEPKLTLASTTLDGITTTRELTPKEGLKLEAGKEFTYSFPVPDRLASLTATLTGKVEKVSTGGEKQDVSASHHWELNGIDKTENTNSGYLAKFGENYVFELLGKTGEPLVDQQVVFDFVHLLFTRRESVPLRTDEKGRINLGPLGEMRSLTARTPNGRTDTWDLSRSSRTWPGRWHAKAGEVIRIPWPGGELTRETASLLLRAIGGTFAQDHFGAMALANGFVEIKGLAPGDYSLQLRLPDGQRPEIQLSITAGDATGEWIVSETRHLKIGETEPLQIISIDTDAGGINVQLANSSPTTRVHVAVTRYVPHQDLFDSFSGFPREDLELAQPGKFPNLYAGGRDIGDEYRYILERRYSKLFPGNMLPRPGLLLNPWEVRSTDLQAQITTGTEAAAATRGGRPGAAPAPASPAADAVMEATQPKPAGPNLDFLSAPAPVIYNLAPDENGKIRIERAWLGDRQYVQILAGDVTDVVWHSFALPEAATKFRDLRLRRPLDTTKAFTETRKVTVLRAGQTLTVADVLGADLETYDSVAAAYSLFTTLNKDAKLAKFTFVTEWPKLSEEEKRAKYSEFACHELHFFLSRKDPQFFEKVVQPYLRNKKDKTFMDDYLVGNDLKSYLEPWSYARLNMAERALLGKRLPAEAAGAERHLKEVWELVPPDQKRIDWLFETALRGFGLAGAREGAFGQAKEAEMRSYFARGRDEYSMDAAGRGIADPQAAAIPGLEAAVKEQAAEEDFAGVPVLGKKMTERGTVARHRRAPVLQQSLERLKELREQIRPFYRRIGPTKEWAENNYFQLRIVEQNAELIPINTFWRDFAAWDGKTPFLSEHFPEASRNFSEMLLALAVLDLPFEPAKHQTRTENNQYTLTASSPLLAFHKEIQVAQLMEGENDLLLSESFFRHDDRYRVEGNEKFDKYVTDEFLPGVVYGANVVVTNPSSAPKKIEVLIQIPEGAMPVLGSKTTDSRRLQLGPYSTQTLEYFFYFPVPGKEPFTHYPAHVSKDDKAAGAAKATTFKVVPQLSQVDKASWEYLSQYGTDEEVFTYLQEHNILRLDLEQIAWRVRRSVEFFRKLITLLQSRHTYSPVIYSYAVVHNEAAVLNEWLKHREDFLAQCGPFLASPLLIIDPIERRAYEHLEYAPLINQRRHNIGSERRIPNPVFRAQYQGLMNILAHKPTLDAEDQMSVVYYLLLQDRVEEALAWFRGIQPETLPTRLQHDYFRCYAAFYEEQLAEARGVASQYAQYPVERWRRVFVEVLTQLDEIEGKNIAPRSGKANGSPDREAQQGNLAATEPSFDFKVENKQIQLTWRNMDFVTVNYYLMDPEFLFSSSPFVTADPGRFSIIKPTRSDRIALEPGNDTKAIPLPEEFAKANVLIEVLGAGQRKTQAYHANTLQVILTENYGHLNVREAGTGKPVSKAYVKVYARLKNGTVRFYKDGYTDLRGRFDYASLNTGLETPEPPRPLDQQSSGGSSEGGNLSYQMLKPTELGEVEKLSILLLSPANGTLVREINPPAE